MITILSVIWMMFGYALGFLLSDAAKAGGVKTERAGAAVLGETLPLSGRV